jgi:hypothetical protein
MTTNVYLDPKIWGPHYWFFLHTVALTYPNHPNAVTKKKYYDLFHNLPLFIPVDDISKEFESFLTMYPITPYLDNKNSLIKWTHFIHNKINEKLEKSQISLQEFYDRYYNAYKSDNEKLKEYYKLREKLVFGFFIVSFLATSYYLYDK